MNSDDTRSKRVNWYETYRPALYRPKPSNNVIIIKNVTDEEVKLILEIVSGRKRPEK